MSLNDLGMDGEAAAPEGMVADRVPWFQIGRILGAVGLYNLYQTLGVHREDMVGMGKMVLAMRMGSHF